MVFPYRFSEVESLNSSRGYTTSADMWSLGVLTACMLTGHSVIPRDGMSQLSQQEIADLFLVLDDHTRHKWQNLTSRALRFLRALLSTKPDQRMTATQALDHSWFKKPLTEATLMETKYRQVIQFWNPRSNGDQVIEHLPSRIKLAAAERSSKARLQFQQNIPDTSNSPYFSLDRHLREIIPSQKMIILEKANHSKSLFVEADGPLKRKKHSLHPLRHNTSIRDVSAKDIFGKSSYEFVEEETQDEDVNMIDLTANSTHSDGASTKRRRIESEYPKMKRLHDEVAKSLPRFANAKVLRDAFARKKEQLGI
jgi:serine/threonine protein kinase